jgi:hypothetical protein
MFSKIHWGYRIAILYGAFVLMIVIMVLKIPNQQSDLVKEDYYQEELQYQQTIDMLNKTNAQGGKVALSLTGDTLHLQFPARFSGMVKECNIYFMRPAGAKDDKKIKLQTNTNDLPVCIKDMKKGFYKMKLNWKAGNELYLNEFDITL